MDIHFFFKILNFLLFAGLLVYFLRRPVGEYWRHRSAELKSRVDSALAKWRKAESEYKKLSDRLHKIPNELKKMKEKMEDDGRLERERIVADARERIKKMEETSEHLARQEEIKARARIREGATLVSVGLARKLIEEKITPQDQASLTARYINELELYMTT